jgi:hypothetical protein
MAFRVGQEVTLKESDRAWGEVYGRPVPGGWLPRMGAVYVVTRIDLILGTQFLTFAEDASGWDAREFRPVVKPTTDISIFTRMLDQARSPELVT